MKSLLIVCSAITLVTGCNSGVKQEANVQSLILNDNIKKAQSQGDYRLYATSGRRLVFPGIDNSKFEEVIKRCGKKYMPNMGDVVKSTEEKNERAKNFQYMSLFNKRMIVDCFNQINS
ncbi:MAG: hypothetical protein ACPGSN_06770 [Psychrobium sp.]